MSNFSKIIEYIRINIPDYEYNIKDFRMNDGEIIYWDHNKLGNIPKKKDFENLIPKKKIIPNLIIPWVSNESELFKPQKGAIAYIDGELKIYDGDKWIFC